MQFTINYDPNIKALTTSMKRDSNNTVETFGWMNGVDVSKVI